MNRHLRALITCCGLAVATAAWASQAVIGSIPANAAFWSSVIGGAAALYAGVGWIFTGFGVSTFIRGPWEFDSRSKQGGEQWKAEGTALVAQSAFTQSLEGRSTRTLFVRTTFMQLDEDGRGGRFGALGEAESHKRFVIQEGRFAFKYYENDPLRGIEYIYFHYPESHEGALEAEQLVTVYKRPKGYRLPLTVRATMWVMQSGRSLVMGLARALSRTAYKR